MAITDIIGKRTNNPKEEEKGDEAWCQYRYHRFHRSSEGAHGHPGHHPVYDKARAAIAEVKAVSAGYKKRIEEPTID